MQLQALAVNDPRVAQSLAFALQATLPYLLNRAGVRIGASFSEEIKRYRLNLPEWRILAVLAARSDPSLTELAEQTSIELSTLSRLVTTMQRRRLVARRPSGADARSIAIRITPAGRELVGRVIPLAELYERIALAGVDPAEVALLKRLLVRIYENIGALAKPRRARARAATISMESSA